MKLVQDPLSSKEEISSLNKELLKDNKESMLKAQEKLLQLEKALRDETINKI